MGLKNPELVKQEENTEPVAEAVSVPKPAAPKLAPVTVGNPESADSMAIDQSHLEEYVSSDEKSSTVECKKPPKGTFFTIRPEPTKPWKDRAFYFLLQVEGRDPLIVSPKIAELKKDEDTIRPILLVRYVTMAGEEGLWPVKLDTADGKSNRWNRSALNILEIASDGKWVRMVSSKNEYRYQVSKRTYEETPPRFSDRTYKQLVNEAFKERVVTDLEHEIWDVLENGSNK